MIINYNRTFHCSIEPPNLANTYILICITCTDVNETLYKYNNHKTKQTNKHTANFNTVNSGKQIPLNINLQHHRY